MPHALTSWRVLLAVALLSLGLPAWTPSAEAVTSADCTTANLTALAPSDTTITAAAFQTATSSLPEYCRVDGFVTTPGDTVVPNNTVPFRLGLPTNWNGKFLFIGVGGFAGQIGSLNSGLVRGYATASTDTGHQTANNTIATWALNNIPKQIDYGYRGTHVTIVASKSLTNSFYASSIRHAYFNGCSNGGRQALMEVQRYPADFDGVIAGDPSFGTGGQLNRIFDYQALLLDQDHFIPASKLTMLANAITAECDAKDGLADGLIDDPRRCSFDPASIQCTGADAPTCLTAGQVETFRKMTAGAKDATGKQITPGYPVGHEDGGDGWQQWITGTNAQAPTLQNGQLVFANGFPLGYAYMDGFVKYLAFPTNQDANRTFRDFNLATDLPKLAQAEIFLSPIDPNITPFKNLGGKLLIYHGWADPALSLLSTLGYYKQVSNVVGGKAATDSFLRFFTVPGMHHCSGGPGPNSFDILTALEQWAENGIAPDRIIASHSTAGSVDRTRPLCPYPQVARYTGGGSINDAANFVCTYAAGDQFRDVRRMSDIGGGTDLRGGVNPTVNFTGGAASSGDTWITLYHSNPSDQEPQIYSGSIHPSADVMITRYDNIKGAGVVALYDESSTGKGLALVAFDNGNSDVLALSTVDHNGRLVTLASVALGGGVGENAWYRVDLNVAIDGGTFTVTGKVFRHVDPTDPESVLGAQVGGTLMYSGGLSALGLHDSGQVGLIAYAKGAQVASSAMNFTPGPGATAAVNEQ